MRETDEGRLEFDIRDERSRSLTRPRLAREEDRNLLLLRMPSINVMSSAAQSFSILLVIAAAGLASVGVFAVQHRTRPGVRGFVLAVFSAAVWSAILAVNVYPTQFLPAHVSMAFRNGLVLSLVLGWFWFVLEYVRRDRVKLRPLPVALVLVIPVLTLVLTITNPLHHLALGPGTPVYVGGGPDIDWGPWHLVFMLYAFVVGFVPAGLLLQDLLSAHGPHRRQILLILAGFVVAVLGANDYLLTSTIGAVPSYVRLSPFAYLLTAGLWSLALFRHQLFGIVPVSRRTVVETIPDPVIAVDQNELVVDFNPAARALFDAPEDATGAPLTTFCRRYPTIVDFYRDGVQGAEFEVDDGGGTRYFSVTCERIAGDRASSVLVLRDVTPIKRRQQQLERQNERLDRFALAISHDLRNPLNMAKGYTAQAERTGDEAHFRTVDRMHDRMDRMIDELLKLARAETSVEEAESVSLAAFARQVWKTTETTGGELELEVPEDVAIEVNRELFGHILENLFRNATEHNDPPVTVRVGVLTEGATTTGLYVEDDGRGVPVDVREVMFDHGYTTNRGGTGVGLSIVNECVEAHGWQIDVTDGADGGARFEIVTGR